MENLIITLVVGGVAGWLAGIIMKGGSFGIVGNIIVGIVGAVIGNSVFNLLNIHIGGDALISSLITATIGAIILLFLIGLIKRK